ncbi:MAG: lamin tail domain-containing protein [Pirellulales bacterium]
MLAVLTGQWVAGDLDPTHADGGVVGVWADSIGAAAANGEGSPRLVKGALNGRSVVRFDPLDGGDAFLIAAADSPMSAAGDFSLSVVFAASQADPTPLLVEDFNGFTAPPANFNGGQYQSGLPVAFSGDLPAWSKSGGGVVHAVNHTSSSPANFATMIWQDNVITLNGAITGSNVSGKAYRIDFQASPAVYQAPSQQTSATDGLLVEVLRPNGSVLASYTHLPGAWAGNIVLQPGGFQYVGDGSGDVRLRVGPSSFNSGRFGGAIDNLSLSEVDSGPPASGPAWFDHVGLIDANQGGATADWGLSLTTDGRLAAGVGGPSSTRFSSRMGLGDGRPHAVIVTRSGNTMSLSVDGVTDTLAGVSGLPRAVLDMAFGRLLDDRNYFSGDIADIRIYDGALSTAEVTALNTLLLDTYRNDPPIAVDDQYEVAEDTPLVVTAIDGVLDNDIDEENDPLSAVLVQGPLHGTLELAADGSFTYRARANYFGPDSFTYRASDGEFDSNVAMVAINVLPVVDTPQAASDEYLVAAGTSTSLSAAVGVLANDFHPDDIAFVAVLASNVAHGNLTFNSDGSFTYVPEAGFVGTDQFTYRVDDGSALSAPALVVLNVTATPVVISEFMASNDTTLATRVRASSGVGFSGGLRYFDWIELRNLSTTTLDIGGFHLTDRSGNLTRWQFPAGTMIPAAGHLVVFASGLDITDPALDERGYLHADFQLGASGDYLAVTAPNGEVLHQYAPRYPVQFTDVSYGITADPIPGFFLSPTPGAANANIVDTAGPIVSEVTENPGVLADDADLVVTARVRSRHAAIDGVDMVYRAMFGVEQTIAMRDDGLGVDTIAGDGVYAAAISAAATAPGEMLRWKVIARDVQGIATTEPLSLDNTGERRSPQYFGTIVDDPTDNTQLSQFHWFIQNPSAANVESGTRSSVFFNGEFYDNVFSGSRGATAQSVNKKSYKFEFNVGHDFRYAPDEPRVTEINVNSTFQDKAYIRPLLTFESYADAGVAASDSFVWRIEQNGQFFSVADFVEQVDADFLDKHGLDADGALYKMFNGVTSSTSGVEKKTREYEGNADLQALVDGVRESNPNREAYIFDNFDIPAMIDYATAGIISQDFDRWAKNFYLYRDTNGTGEWLQIPHDKDLTFGNRFYDDEISGDGFTVEIQAGLSPTQYRAHPFQAASEYACCGIPNWMIDALVDNPRTREMYLRRLRTLMDEQLQPPGTPIEDRHFETRIDELAAAVAPDAALDLAKWGAIYGSVIDFPTSIEQLKTNYLDERRVYLYETHGVGNPSSMPTTLIDEFAAGVRYFVPVNNNLGQSWTALGFNDATWTVGQTGLGYQNETGVATCPVNPTGDYAGLLRTCVKPQLTNASATSVFARLPFTLDSLAGVSGLTLQMKYDDAFIAYINGVEVARMNVSGSPQWNSTSTTHANTSAVTFENFTIDVSALPAGTLRDGDNVLAIHALNSNTASSDMLLLPKLLLGALGSGGVGIPNAQVGNPPIEFGVIDVNPVSANQDEEYIELINNGTDAVDISGWKLTGGVTHTFKSGTIIPAGGSLYVSPDVKTFRARATGPSGGQSLFVQGNYQGHLSNFGETIVLVATDGETVATITTQTIPSDVQQFLRITELMYHPANPTAAELAAGFDDGDLFEFAELYNTSATQSLQLAGTNFSNGVSFTFADYTLPPGGYVLVVSNQAAFAARYGASLPVAGQYTGNLSNGGESLSLDDADNSSVHDFTYDDTGEGWQPTTDGGGYSLVIVDPTADLTNWNVAAGWRPSFEVGGSPGERDAMLGDFDGDNDVDLADLAFLQGRFGTPGGATKASGDLTGDGMVDRGDVGRFARGFGRFYVSPAVPASPVAAANALVRTTSRQILGSRVAELVARRRERTPEASAIDDVFASVGARRFLSDGETSLLRAIRRTR